MRRKLNVAISKDSLGYSAKCVEVDGIYGRGETMRSAFVQLQEKLERYFEFGNAVPPRPMMTFIDIEVRNLNVKTDYSGRAVPECPRCGDPADPTLGPYCSAPCKRHFRGG